MCAIGGHDGFHLGNDRFAIGISRGRSSGRPKNEQPHTIKDGDCQSIRRWTTDRKQHDLTMRVFVLQFCTKHLTVVGNAD